MKVRSEDILNISFSGSIFGYNRKEVDEFLDEAAEQMRALEREREEMILALDTLMKQVDSMNGKKEEQEKSEKDGNAQAKPSRSRERKAPVAEREHRNDQSASDDVEPSESEEQTEIMAPIRPIHRGTGERSKRTMPAFLRPKPFDAEAGESSADAEPSTVHQPESVELENETPQTEAPAVAGDTPGVTALSSLREEIAAAAAEVAADSPIRKEIAAAAAKAASERNECAPEEHE